MVIGLLSNFNVSREWLGLIIASAIAYAYIKIEKLIKYKRKQNKERETEEEHNVLKKEWTVRDDKDE